MTPLRILAASLLLVFAGVITSDAVAQQLSETRDVASFSQLHLKVPGDVELSQGSEQRVEIRASSQDVLDAVDTRVVGDRLVIDGDFGDSGFLSRLLGNGVDGDDLSFRITMTSVNGLQVDGTGDIEGQTPISTEKLEIEVNGTGDVELSVTSDRIETRISGTGDVELEGETDQHYVSISGTGDVEAPDLVTRETTARVSGTGDCLVHATESLKARVSGLGDIRYLGDPASVDRSTSGLGSIEPYEP